MWLCWIHGSSLLICPLESLGVNSFSFLFPRIYSGALSMFQYTVTIAINCFGGMDVCNMVYESHWRCWKGMRPSSLEQEGTNRRGQELIMNTQEAGCSGAWQEQQSGWWAGTSSHKWAWNGTVKGERGAQRAKLVEPGYGREQGLQSQAGHSTPRTRAVSAQAEWQAANALRTGAKGRTEISEVRQLLLISPSLSPWRPPCYCPWLWI